MNDMFLNEENGHLVFPFFVDVPMSCQIEESTGRLVIDSPTVRVGTMEKAGVLRLTFSPEAAHSLLQALLAVEEKLGVKIGSPEIIKLQ